jgi:ketosteroid isomerase-like protein
VNVRILLIAILFGLPASVAGAASTGVLTSADAAVQKQLIASAHAFERHDLTALAATFVNDESLTIFEGGEVNRGWRDYRDNHIKPELSEILIVRYSLSAIESHVVGSTAWAIFRYHIKGSTAKRQFDSSGIGTAILEKRAGSWRIVHWHSTKTPKPAK